MEENVTQDNNATGVPKKSKVKWIVAVVIAVIIIAAIANGGSDDDNDVKKVNSKGSTTTKVNNDSLQETVPQKTAFGIGETAEYKDIQVTLEKVITSEGDDIFTKPDDGKEFVLCVFKIENNSDKDISISSIVDFEAYLDDTSINEDYMGSQTEEGKKYNSLDGDIASGKKMEGVISYEAPKDWKKLEVNVTPDTWSSKKITFVAKNK